MTSALHVLIVDDSPSDAELLLGVLRRGGFDPVAERVDTADAMAQALDTRSFDLVISDWNMPRFSATDAFAIMREKDLDLPFLIVSGTVGEETAIEALRAGAHDFMPKDRPTRLVTAVQRELREAALRRERRTIQEQLLLADRMASVGLLAAGVAHEISNPLTSVMANLELALGGLDQPRGSAAGGEVRECLQNAVEGAGAICRLIQDLKVFSRGEHDARTLIDVRQALDFALRMASHEVRMRARLIKEYGEVPQVKANGSRLGQVFLNLIVNAAQAIEPGRTDANEIRLVTRTDARGWVAIEVHDTGCGMPKEILGRLFTPFLTTKPSGVGTGLGLSICHRIVTELGGNIAVESVVGKGTTFEIVLPPGEGLRLAAGTSFAK